MEARVHSVTCSVLPRTQQPPIDVRQPPRFLSLKNNSWGEVMGELYEQTAWTDASAYESFMGRWSELLAPLFIRVASIPSGSHVLDVGCGTGVLSKALAE